MSWYVPSKVAEDLAGELVTGWVARIEGTHQIIPDGCVDVLWIGNGTAWVPGVRSPIRMWPGNAQPERRSSTR